MDFFGYRKQKMLFEVFGSNNVIVIQNERRTMSFTKFKLFTFDEKSHKAIVAFAEIFGTIV